LRRFAQNRKADLSDFGYGNSSYYNAATQPGPISIREPDAKDD